MKNKNEHNKKYFREIMKLGGTGKRQNFLGRTFSTKFFLKYCSNLVDLSFVCFQILSYEPENRTKEDIEKASPWLYNLKNFYDFLSIKETKENIHLLINKITWVLNREVYKKNSIIKRAGDKNKIFNLILQGNIIKLDLIAYRKVLSLEEYLIYLIKIKLIKEKEIFNKCKLLNKSFVKIKDDSIKSFCIRNHINDYEILKVKAIKELNNLDMNINDNYEEEELNDLDIRINSLNNYLNIFLVQINAKRQHEKSKAYYNFYLFKYEKNGELNDGNFFGTFLKNEIKEYSTYISKDKCNIGILKKDLHFIGKLYELMLNKKIKIFQELKDKFFLFHHIKEDVFCNNYAPFMVYKKYYKGEKIFLQNSCFSGIFLVQSGEIRININASTDDLYNLITYLTFALNGFQDYISGFTSKDYINDQINQQNQRIKSHHTLDHDTVKKYIEKNNYTLMIIKEFNILGTNETYHHQTEIYNFSAECISDEALLYFLPKENLNIMLNKEKMVYNSLIQLVEFRIKDIIWKIKDYIKIFEKKINRMKLKKDKDTLHSSTDNDINNYNNENKLQITPIKDNSKIIYRNNLNQNFAKTSFTKRNLFTKLSLSKEIHNNIAYTFRKTRNQFVIKNTPKMPSLKQNLKNMKNEYKNKYSYSKRKNKNINPIPSSFPYLIIDTFSKRELYKDKDNILRHIKASNDIKPIKIKKLFLNDYNSNQF